MVSLISKIIWDTVNEIVLLDSDTNVYVPFWNFTFLFLNILDTLTPSNRERETINSIMLINVHDPHINYNYKFLQTHQSRNVSKIRKEKKQKTKNETCLIDGRIKFHTSRMATYCTNSFATVSDVCSRFKIRE